MSKGFDAFEECALSWLGTLPRDMSLDDALAGDEGDAYTLGQLRGFAMALGMTALEVFEQLGVDSEHTAAELILTNMRGVVS